MNLDIKSISHKLNMSLSNIETSTINTFAKDHIKDEEALYDLLSLIKQLTRKEIKEDTGVYPIYEIYGNITIAYDTDFIIIKNTQTNVSLKIPIEVIKEINKSLEYRN